MPMMANAGYQGGSNGHGATLNYILVVANSCKVVTTAYPVASCPK